MKKPQIWKDLEATAEEIKKQTGREALPDTLIILGSGFKGFERRLNNALELDLSEIGNMPVPKVEGHGSSLVIGELNGREICILTGRVHAYEGYTPGEVVFPLRVLSTLGVQRVLLTNAAGSVDPDVRPGTVVLIKDHINLTGQNCLVGPDARALGQVFIDMGNAYDKIWRQAILKKETLVEGVYAGVLGPSYETPSETAMLKKLGATVVGMSTVHETIAARQLNLKVAGLSFVTNMAGGLGGVLDHEDVVELATENRARLHQLITDVLGADNE
jgi:purine-nucleoside phosphorylase